MQELLVVSIVSFRIVEEPINEDLETHQVGEVHIEIISEALPR